MPTADTLRTEAASSLDRVKNFDVKQLVQRDRLGQFSFEVAVEPAKKLVGVFALLPDSILDALPDTEVTTIKQNADATYQRFQEILDFDLEQPDPRSRHDQAVDKIKTRHQAIFTALFPLISYSMARTVDFNQLEDQGRAAVQDVKDRTQELLAEIEAQQASVKQILDDVRKAAAEQGVSQQASYFKNEADEHKQAANDWRLYTIIMAGAVGLYGILLLLTYRIPFFTPSSIYETIQLTFSKAVVFFVLTYLLYLCSKNFISNRHNEIVNRHRQNALMTYKALVDAGGTPEARDVVLAHAASSIYKLHETGYARSADGSGGSSSSIIEMLPRTSFPLNTGSGGT